MWTRRQTLAAGLAASLPAAKVESEAPPQVAFGQHRISRLIVGGNPVSGHSHVSAAMSREMIDYFTAANVKRLLAECERAGINTWQSRGDRHIVRLLHEHRMEGGRIQWIAQTASELVDIPRHIRELAGRGPIGIYHHGSMTDKYWAEGRMDHVRENLKVIRQTGVRVGLGTHIPEVIDYAESADWDVDFYMTCVYNLSRSSAEAARVAGRPVEGELFWPADREKMLERVRNTAKQCLIFKVYGAGRHCGSAEDKRQALQLVSRFAKPQDCLVVGMFPKHSEQVRENCRLLREAFPQAQS